MEFVGDEDPQRRAERGPGRGVERIAQRAAQEHVGRGFDGERLAGERAGIDQKIDEKEQADEQRDRSPLVRLDVGVESVGGHCWLKVLLGWCRNPSWVLDASFRDAPHHEGLRFPTSSWGAGRRPASRRMGRPLCYPLQHQIFTGGACSSALRSAAPTSKKSFGEKPSAPASSTAGNCWMPVLYSCTALLKKRRAAAILFSMSESWAWSCWKFWLALRSGEASLRANSCRSAPVSAFSAAAWAAPPPDRAAIAALRACTTASSVPRSWPA